CGTTGAASAFTGAACSSTGAPVASSGAASTRVADGYTDTSRAASHRAILVGDTLRLTPPGAGAVAAVGGATLAAVEIEIVAVARNLALGGRVAAALGGGGSERRVYRRREMTLI